ncbi:WD40-repeat-containing domain protein [Fusarium oxysporum]|nr:WD40-repeat-containing domain protein [Fusarium oxysporum]
MNGNEVSIDPYALTEILFTQEMVHSLSISPDGSQIAMALTDWHLNFGKGSVELIEIRTGSCVHNFCNQECMSQSLAYSPDGKHLLIQSGFDINVHSLQTRNVGSTREYASHYGPLAELETIENLVDIKRVVISPNGHFLVSEDDARLKLWDLSGETYEGQLAVHIHALDDLEILSFSADSESLMSCAKNMFYIWMMGKISNAESSPQDPEYKIQAQLSICSDGLSLRSASGPDPVGIRPELSSSQISASWVNGRTAAVYNLRTLEVWKLGPALKRHFAFATPGEQQMMAVALSANDEYLAVAYGTTLKVWALKDSFRASDPKTIEQVMAMALSPKGFILALASFSTICIWTTTSRDGPRCLFQHEISRSSIHLPLEQSPTRILVLGLVSTSNTLVAARSFPNPSVILWDESSGLKFLVTKPGNGGYSDISFSRDETHVYLTGRAFIDCYRIKSDVSELGFDKEIRILFDEEEWIYYNGQRFLKFMLENLSQVWYGGNRLAVGDSGKLLLFHFE